MKIIDFPAIEKKWQRKWEKAGIFKAKESRKVGVKGKYYVLEMYPYPSALGLHMGHAFNYSIGDIQARLRRMQGFNVLYPMGFDSFGLPAENAAINAGAQPKKFTDDAIANYVKQMKEIGLSYDWSKTLKSHDPEYYKWNQYFFIQFFKKGLAYRKKASVNWCEKCRTVLANEQVVQGKCWRHEDTEVEIRQLEQWFLKTTEYAEELLKDIEKLDWPERIKAMQRNWIGKSEGTEVDFDIDERDKNISNVVVVHGSPGLDKTKDKDYTPDSKKAWIGWIKKELGKREIRCDCPQMPTPWKPEYSEWKREFEKIPIDENSVLVGTSAGGGFLVRWLGEEKVKIKKLILVSPGKVGNSDRLKEFYGDVFYKNVKDLVREKIVIYTSEDDIDYHINSAEEYNKEFGGKFVKFGKGYGHFTSKTLVGNDFPELLDEILNSESLKVFTTRPDTLFGVTFLVVSASHPELMSLVANGHEGRVKDFLRKLKSVKQEDLDKLDKEGVFTGSYAEHPLTGEKIPIWVGNFVVAGYGSGIVMGVPAHDERDFEFAKKYGLDVRPVVLKSHNESYSYIMGVNWRDIEKFDFKIIEKTKNGFFKVKISFDKLEEYKEFIRKNMKEGFWNEFSTKDGFYFIFKHKDGRIEEMELNKKTNDLIDKYGATFNDEKPKKTPENVYSWLAKNDFYKELLIHSDSGFLINSEGFDGLQNREAINHITKALESKNLGKKKIEYKLRDWLISRQRYWGTPIPMIYCDSCGIVPELERNLPVKLPEKVKYGKGNPLASSKSFVETKCPGCGRKAKRETDTMDTFFDSSWYYLRYLDAKNKKKPFDSKKVDYWMPINQYIGGAEHAVLHLIYARFFTKVLRDLGYFGKNKIDEPFSRLFNQGTLHAEDGRRMSKSYGNVVLPEVISKKYGMDAARLFLVSIASPDKNLNWSDKGIEGSLRFILQVVDFANNFKEKKETKLQESKLNRTIRDYTSDLEEFRYNLAVIKLRNLFDVLKEGCDKKSFESFLKMLSVICPHIAEELWSKIKGKGFVSLAEWPEFDKEKIDDELEEIEGRVEKTIDDAKNILKIVEDRGNKTNKIYIYVLPNELEFYDSKKLSVRIGKEVAVYSVSDKSKYDPSGIAKKTKPGRPGIYVE